jgi:lipopolysaccharide export LptBFGC system permease protein LptF
MSYASVDRGEYDDLTIVVYNSEGLLSTLHARSARIEYLRYSGMLNLTRCFDLRMVPFDPRTGTPNGTPMVAEQVVELRVPFDFGSEKEPQSNKALGTFELLKKVRKDIDREADNSGASAELVRRSGLTLGGLVLPLLGALLAGMINHPNRLLAIGVGVIPAAVGYYPVMTAAATLAEKATLSPLAAALLAPAAAMVAIVLAAWRVTQGRWR